MEDAEIKRRLIGLLTLAYRDEWDPDAGADLDTLASAVGSLMEQIGIYEISGEVPLDKYTVVEELLESGMIGLSPDVLKVISNFVAIFVALCNEIKVGHPDFDIDGFLQREGLRAADDE